MKILIFGAGAMGSVFGGFLSAGHDVTLIGRDPHIHKIAETGLRVSGIWGEHLFCGVSALTSVSRIPKDKGFDLVMITTKSNDTGAAVRKIAPFISDQTHVMSMQNGIGNEDVIAGTFGKGRTMGGMAIFGARLVEPGHVEVTVYASECLVGMMEKAVTTKTEEVARAFTLAGIPTRASEDIIRDKWMKAFYNIALNPLSAILRVPYGELGGRDETKRIMKALLKEAFSVAEALGISLSQSWEEYFTYLLEKQLPPTAGHRSSMLQDIERGRPTEIDYLNGAVVKLGSMLGIEAPVNAAVSDIIRALERRG